MIMNGYETITHFWQAFSIADLLGIFAIRITFNLAFKKSKKNYKYLTDLERVLNKKIFQYAEKNHKLLRVYNDYWNLVTMYAWENLFEEELSYFCGESD